MQPYLHETNIDELHDGMRVYHTYIQQYATIKHINKRIICHGSPAIFVDVEIPRQDGSTNDTWYSNVIPASRVEDIE